VIIKKLKNGDMSNHCLEPMKDDQDYKRTETNYLKNFQLHSFPKNSQIERNTTIYYKNVVLCADPKATFPENQ
jgi:hypothetical protein